MPGQLNCRAGGRALNKENRVCVMYTWEISGDGGRRKVVIPPHILLRLYRAGLIRNRHGLFVLSEPVLPPALPTSVSPSENTCILLL